MAAWATVERRYRGPRPTRGAVMLLKPFPLEYAVGSGPDTGCPAALEARQRAMRRHYARLLGSRPLQGGSWMWFPLAEQVPVPRSRKR